MARMDGLNLQESHPYARPTKVEPIPFEKDETHRSYDAEYANRFWRVLAAGRPRVQAVSSAFSGKCSPVHFFWGGSDLAVTRFSGRRAPRASGRHAASAGLGHARGLLARSQQLRLLARRRTRPLRGFLFLCVPRAHGFATASRAPPAAFYARTCANSSCLTRPCVQQPPRTTRCCSFSRRRTRPQPSWAIGTVAHWSVTRIREPLPDRVSKKRKAQ